MFRLSFPHVTPQAWPQSAVLMTGTAIRQAYHLGDASLAQEPQPQTAWCGARASVVDAGDLETWGQVTEGNERYCPQCAALARQRHVVLGPASPNRSLWRRLTPA
jgi:hypothetical protein